MEEVFLAILGGDEAKAAVGNNLLDVSCGHIAPFCLPEPICRRTACSRSRSTTRSTAAHCDDLPRVRGIRDVWAGPARQASGPGRTVDDAEPTSFVNLVRCQE